MEKKRVTKQARILNHLKRGWKLTNMVAFEKYGYTRLGSIIYQLRQSGVQIDTVDRFDSEGNKYAEYRLHR